MAIGTPVVGTFTEAFAQSLTLTAPGTINDDDFLTALCFIDDDI